MFCWCEWGIRLGCSLNTIEDTPWREKTKKTSEETLPSCIFVLLLRIAPRWRHLNGCTQNGLLTYSLKKAEITKRPIYSTCTWVQLSSRTRNGRKFPMIPRKTSVKITVTTCVCYSTNSSRDWTRGLGEEKCNVLTKQSPFERRATWTNIGCRSASVIRTSVWKRGNENKV